MMAAESCGEPNKSKSHLMTLDARLTTIIGQPNMDEINFPDHWNTYYHLSLLPLVLITYFHILFIFEKSLYLRNSLLHISVDWSLRDFLFAVKVFFFICCWYLRLRKTLFLWKKGYCLLSYRHITKPFLINGPIRTS